MSSEPNFAAHRKSYEFEQNFDHAIKESSESKLSPDNYESASENLLTDYEVVSNEEIEDEPDSLSHRSSRKLENLPKIRSFPSNDGKLCLRLSAEQIALKSQNTKIDKSIAQETETGHMSNVSKQKPRQRREKTPNATSNTTATFCQRHKRMQQQQQQKVQKLRPPQHVPIAFTIVPIDMAQSKPEQGFEHDKTSAPTTATIRKVRPASTVTFQTANGRIPISKIPTPPPPPMTTATTPTKIPNATVKKPEVVVVIEKIENSPVSGQSTTPTPAPPKPPHEPDDNSNSEINSQPGSSTSPESLMDNILSGASSVSVRSSSLSSGGIEMPQIAATSTDGKQRMPQVTVQGSADAAVVVESHAALTVKETTVNRALNSKSTELKVFSLAPPTPGQQQQQVTLGALSPMPSPVPTPITGATTIATTTMALLHASPTTACADTNSNRSRSPSPSRSISIRITPDPALFPDNLKCIICSEVFRDPRTLNCLHSFCFQCLVDENFKQDSSIPFWTQPGNEEQDWKEGQNKSIYSIRSSSPEMSLRSESTSPSRNTSRHASFSFKRKKSLDRLLLKPKPDGKNSQSSSSLRLNHMPDERPRTINCKICNYATELSIGGIRQLPQNFLLIRKIEAIKQKIGDEVITRVWCSLCFEETNATYHCCTCTLNLCTLCKESHERQRNTANHKIRNIMELRRARKQQQSMLDDNTKFTLKCGMHPGFEMKSFCCTCLQVACADCLVLLHKGHKHELIAKAFNSYSKLLRDSTEHARPLCAYAEHSIERLNDIAKRIKTKCDEVQQEVETFMNQYYQAVEVHRKTLLQQVHRARESKVEMILEQQLDLERRNAETMEAIHFSQDLCNVGSNIELLAFLNILLKRFEYCQQFKMPIDPKISDSLHFLPEIRAPATKAQNDIPLFGIITMQTVDPALCTLQWEGFSHLRLHKRVELLLLSRDADGVPLCHGGLQINAMVKYKEFNAKFLPVEVADNRDGTYGIGFTPDAQGTILLTVTINDKPIKGNPFTFLARTVRPHSGIYHCCAFCSSKGNKMVKCSCDGRMPGYNGCGHGHSGHPGSRHWSCCGNILEHSECNVANKLLNP